MIRDTDNGRPNVIRDTKNGFIISMHDSLYENKEKEESLKRIKALLKNYSVHDKIKSDKNLVVSFSSKLQITHDSFTIYILDNEKCKQLFYKAASIFILNNALYGRSLVEVTIEEFEETAIIVHQEFDKKDFIKEALACSDTFDFKISLIYSNGLSISNRDTIEKAEAVNALDTMNSFIKKMISESSDAFSFEELLDVEIETICNWRKIKND